MTPFKPFSHDGGPTRLAECRRPRYSPRPMKFAVSRSRGRRPAIPTPMRAVPRGLVVEEERDPEADERGPRGDA